jgi:hypothetical protein
MRPRHLLLLAPLLLVAACADQTASDSSADTATEASAVAVGEAVSGTGPAVTTGSGRSATEDPVVQGAEGPIDKEAAVAREIALKDLDTLRKSGQEILLTQSELTDEALRDAVVVAAVVTSEVTADGATGVRVTATEGETSCTGIISFKSGSGTWNEVTCS